MSTFYQLSNFQKTNAEIAKVLSFHPSDPGGQFGKEICVYRLQVPLDLKDGDRIELWSQVMISNGVHNGASGIRAAFVGCQFWLERDPPMWNSYAPMAGAVRIGEPSGGNVDAAIDKYRPVQMFSIVELLAGAAGWWIAVRAKCSSEAATISDRLVVIDSQGAMYMKHWKKVEVSDEKE
jgi:hypothetical protein